MAAKWIGPQRIHIRNQLGSQRIQMNVPHQLEQIGIFLAQDRFVAVLKQVSMASMAPVEACGASGQQSPHHGGDWGLTGPQQKMGMIWYQCPCVTSGSGVLNNFTQPFEKTLSVLIIQKYFPAFNTPDNDMVKGAWGVYLGLSGHENGISDQRKIGKFRY